MDIKKFFFLWLVLLQLAIGGSAKASDYTLGASDVIEIRVLQQPDLKQVRTLTDAGEISFPYIGLVNLTGKTEFEAQQILADKLERSKFVKNPEVIVNILEYRSGIASIEGRVVKPGEYPVLSNLTIHQLISRAGGVLDAPSTQATLFRKDQPPIIIDLFNSHNVKLSQAELSIQRGDRVVIEIPAENFFYTYGAVHKPDRYVFTKDMIVMRALAISGGLTEYASEGRITIIRDSISDSGESTVTEIKASLFDEIMPNDVINVGESLF